MRSALGGKKQTGTCRKYLRYSFLDMVLNFMSVNFDRNKSVSEMR